jgi:type II secretory pathway pseudopilin PulG
MRKEKGITLIALVITIIVLLILAGVTIATLTGDNGLLTKSKTAVDKYSKYATKIQIKYLQLLQESYELMSTYYEVMKLKNDLPIEIDRTIVSVKKDIEQLKLVSFKSYLNTLNIKPL